MALGTGLRGLAVAHTLAFVGAALVAVAGVRRVLGPGVLRQALRGPAAAGLQAVRRAAGAVRTMTIALLQRADIIILAAFVEARTVAFYFAAEQLTRSVAGLRHAFDGVAAPLLSESLHQQDRARLRHNLKLLTRWVALAAAPIAASLFTLRPELLSLFGPQHREAAGAMGLLLLGAVDHRHPGADAGGAGDERAIEAVPGDHVDGRRGQRHAEPAAGAPAGSGRGRGRHRHVGAGPAGGADRADLDAGPGAPVLPGSGQGAAGRGRWSGCTARW